MKICIVSSMKFQDQMIEIYNELSMKGYIVYLPVLLSNSRRATLTNDNLLELKKLHKKKIKDSDIIMVVNINNYIGEGTKEELEYAKKYNKYITFIEEV